MAAKPAKEKRELPVFQLGFRHSESYAKKEAPPFRPAFNIGSTIDLQTGPYQKGLRGEMICVGGMGHINGVGGLGNMSKSTILHDMVLTVMERFTIRTSAEEIIPFIEVNAHDTEYTQSYSRWAHLASHREVLGTLDLSKLPTFILTSQGDGMSGNDLFRMLDERFESKRKAGKRTMLTTPFDDARNPGKPLMAYIPSIVEMDSFSQLSTDLGEKIMDENEAGSDKARTVFMQEAGVKTQLFMRAPDLFAQSGGFLVFSAAMGKEIKIEAYSADVKKLAFLKHNLAFKNVPGNITTLSHNLFMLTSAVPEQDNDKKPLYPLNEKDNMENDTDLMKVTLINLRGKFGTSGVPFELIVSQKHGVLHSATEFHHLKRFGWYGLGGSKTDFFLDLYPEVVMNRKVLRSLCSSDKKLARAMTITSELCQIKHLFPEYRDILVSPKKLYEGLKEKGYDWDELLTTRGYWVYKEMEQYLPPFLSTLDLLRMNADLYVPYWKKKAA